MEPIKDVKITVENGVKTLDIRHGQLNPVHIPAGIDITGASIGAVVEYLKKKGVEPEQIEHSFVRFSYEGLFLKLDYAVRREAKSDYIHGELKLHPELEKWQINKAKAYDNMTLSRFIKMNRHFFESPETAMRLVTELRDIKVKAENQFETSDDRRGNARELIAQRVVESNIPASFILKLPVFVGQDPIAVKVEIEINPKDFSCELISPDLKQIIDIETRAIIDAELAQIRELYPELRIFQK